MCLNSSSFHLEMLPKISPRGAFFGPLTSSKVIGNVRVHSICNLVSPHDSLIYIESMCIFQVSEHQNDFGKLIADIRKRQKEKRKKTATDTSGKHLRKSGILYFDFINFGTPPKTNFVNSPRVLLKSIFKICCF